MRHHTVVFRDERREVVVDVDGGYEPDTNVHVIEWHFDGLSPEEHDALGITDDEEQSVYEQIAAASGQEGPGDES